MPWQEITIMSQRLEFVQLALKSGQNFSELCHRFGISRKTGYKFLHRYLKEGISGLEDRSRKPKFSPHITNSEITNILLKLRDAHPVWGPRKLKYRLEKLGHQDVPVPSTIAAILKRHNRVTPEQSAKHKAWRSFEAEAANDLWQMDFKGHFSIKEGRCHPLTILDDHSRYSLHIAACTDERRKTVKYQLVQTFERYGIPFTMLVDNGPPWGYSSQAKFTKLSIWLIRLGIRVIHSRPRHPQTLGKDERFHRTMKAEVIGQCIDQPLIYCQKKFNDWRMIYNYERPHESLDMAVPATRFKLSPRRFPVKLEEIEYGPDDIIRKVNDKGMISFRNQLFRVGKGFVGQYVAIRPEKTDGVFDVYFCYQKISRIKFE